jgi:hypothetical protein
VDSLIVGKEGRKEGRKEEEEEEEEEEEQRKCTWMPL